MELLIGGAARVGAGGGRRETHIFKANHPDDAANWLTDFQVPGVSSRIIPELKQAHSHNVEDSVARSSVQSVGKTGLGAHPHVGCAVMDSNLLSCEGSLGDCIERGLIYAHILLVLKLQVFPQISDAMLQAQHSAFWAPEGYDDCRLTMAAKQTTTEQYKLHCALQKQAFDKCRCIHCHQVQCVMAA